MVLQRSSPTPPEQWHTFDSWHPTFSKERRGVNWIAVFIENDSVPNVLARIAVCQYSDLFSLLTGWLSEKWNQPGLMRGGCICHPTSFSGCGKTYLRKEAVIQNGGLRAIRRLVSNGPLLVSHLSNIVHFKQNTATWYGVLFSQMVEQLEIILLYRK